MSTLLQAIVNVIVTEDVHGGVSSGKKKREKKQIIFLIKVTFRARVQK